MALKARGSIMEHRVNLTTWRMLILHFDFWKFNIWRCRESTRSGRYFACDQRLGSQKIYPLTSLSWYVKSIFNEISCRFTAIHYWWSLWYYSLRDRVCVCSGAVSWNSSAQPQLCIAAATCKPGCRQQQHQPHQWRRRRPGLDNKETDNT